MPPVLAAVGAVASYVIPVIGITVGQAIVGSYLIYGAVKQRRQERAARNAYNAGLTDRTVTFTDANAPWQIVYGQATVGGRVVAQLKSGSRDEYQHLVVVWADHECHAIDDVLINGVSLGTLDGGGYVTSGKYYKASTEVPTASVTLNASGVGTLPEAPDALLGMSYTTGSAEVGVIDEFIGPGDLTLSGTTVTVGAAFVSQWAYRTVRVSYRIGSSSSLVRVRHHLGGAGQTADSSLLAECPSDWSSTDVLADKCYSVIRFSLDEPEFQGGPPRVTAVLRGKKVLNHRTGVTAHSANVADCLVDFLLAAYGKNQPSNAIIWSAQEAAANACDESITVAVGGVATTGPRFTCNGAFTTDADPDETLTALCQAMAGFATFTNGAWHIQAGVYTTPVAALLDSDNAGPVELLPTADGQQMINGLRGQFYDPARFGQRTDYPPYKNSAFVTADGGEDFGSLHLPFTSAAWRCTNLARIQVERSRAGQLLYPAKMSALRRRVGERVLVNCQTLNLTLEAFRIVKKEFRIGGPVMLTLAFDDASMYDEIDAPAPLASPTAPLVDPWVVPGVSGWAVLSSTSIAVWDANGSVISRVRATWTVPTNPYLVTGGALQVEYRLASDAAWTRLPDLNPNGGSAALQGFEYLRAYVVRARWCNALGAVGDWSTVGVETGVRPKLDQQSGFNASQVWSFSGTAEGWSWGGMSSGVSNPTYIRLTSAGSDPIFLSPEFSINGANNTKLRARIRRVSGTGWDGSCFFIGTGTPAFTGSKYKVISDPCPDLNVWVVAEWDMADLTAGGTAWTGATINYIRLDFGSLSGDVFDVDWVAIGTMVPFGRPKLFRATSRGYSDLAAPFRAESWYTGALIDAESNAVVRSNGGMYTVGKISRLSQAYTHLGDFSPLANGLTDANAMADALDTITSDFIAVVTTWDDPQTNRMLGRLPASMYRCGASKAVFGSPQFQFRSAYILIGIGGCGEGNGFEAYNGSVSSDTNAWCDVSFYLQNGQLVISGMGATPRTLADYSYTGALNATYGATFGVNITGEAQTTDLAANAATKVHMSSASSITVDGQTGSPTGDFTTLISYTFTPTVSCDIVLTAEGTATITTPSSAGGGGLGVYAVLTTRLKVNGTQLGALRNYAIDQNIGLSESAKTQIARAQRFAATGGTSYTVILEAQKLYADTVTVVNDVALRLEEIRR